MKDCLYGEYMIGMIDYGRGNLRSVEKALERVGAEVFHICKASDWPSDVQAIVLPGVGAFGDAMANLEERDLVDPLRDWILAGKPFLGICLGFQLLFSGSEENPGKKGLSVLDGKVVRFPKEVGKVPHMGWNQVRFTGEGETLMPPIGSEGEAPFFYHVHSYYPQGIPSDWVACETTYGGISFASGVCRGKVAAFQFHPEKSQDNGKLLLEGFFRQMGLEAMLCASR